MASLSPKDRVSLCQFTFADGRRCRTPRTGKNPHFCFDHAQKEARALAKESLSKDLAYFFSGDYLSACDLSTALGRLIPAVIRGDVKPKTARTVAYMAQILLQAIPIAQHEYINAFDTDNWRDSIRKSVKGNYNHRFPPDPKLKQPESPQPQPAGVAHPFRGEAFRSASPPQPQAQQPAQRQTQPPQPAPSPHTPMPPTSAEFAQQVLAGRNLSRPGRETGCLPTTPHVQPAPPNTRPAETPQAPSAQPDNQPRTGPPTPQPAPSRDGRALHFDHNYRLRIDGKPF